MTTPRDRMIVSTALLIRERGAHATAISDVLEHSGAPRGSAYHHFPGGRTQLLCEAVDYAADYVATGIAAATSSLDALDLVADGFRKQMVLSNHRAGCPVAAVAVEADNPPVVDRAAVAFTRWTTLITQRLQADGVDAGRAGDLATLLIASIEGALLLARTARAVEPLDRVHRQLRSLLRSEIEGTAHDH